MKICFAVDSMNSGGAERVVSTLANQFIKDGDNVTILMVSYNKEESFYPLDKSVNLISLVKGFKKKVRPLKRIKMLNTKIKEISPDIVLSFLPHVIIYTWLALRHTNVPFIVSERNDPNQYSFLYQLLSKLAYKKANGCVFQTSAAMKWYGTFASKKGVVIFNPVFLTCEKKVIKERRNEIVTVGRLTKQKNYFFLLDVFKKFYELYPYYSLSIYGDGPLRKELNDYAFNLGIEHCVCFKGNDSNWHSKSIDSKMFLLLSKYEGMPNALEEAISLGIPSVASDCPIYGTRELIEYFKFGYLAKMNNVDDTIEQMKKCASESKIVVPPNDLSPEVISREWKKYILSKIEI